MRRTRPPADQPVNDLLSVDDLILDRAAHVVMRQGQSIELTPSEFDILQLLMLHPRRAFNRTEIIELALGYEYAGLERTVDSHIKNLRRKLKTTRHPAYIETVFGVGYRLNYGAPNESHAKVAIFAVVVRGPGDHCRTRRALGGDAYRGYIVRAPRANATTRRPDRIGIRSDSRLADSTDWLNNASTETGSSNTPQGAVVCTAQRSRPGAMPPTYWSIC